MSDPAEDFSETVAGALRVWAIVRKADGVNKLIDALCETEAERLTVSAIAVTRRLEHLEGNEMHEGTTAASVAKLLAEFTDETGPE